MKQGTSKALILIVMLASTIAAMVLRQMQLIRVFDADGQPISGSPITYDSDAVGCARRRCRQLDSVRRLDRSHPGTHLRG